MKYKGTRVLLLDGHGRQTAVMLEWLRELGCHITTVNYSKLDIGYSSRYPHVRIVEPKARNDKEYYGSVIDREIRSGKYDVVIPLLEISTDYILQNTNTYESFVKICATNYDAFQLAYDKQTTMTLCMKHDIPCPVTRKEDQTLESYYKEVRFPLALKPRKGTGAIGFHRVENQDELYELIQSGVVNPDQYVIQEFIPQTDTQHRLFIYADDKSEIKTLVVTRCARWYPLTAGPGCLAVTIKNDEIVEYGKKLIAAAKWTGYAHVNFMVDPRDNTPKLIEVNGRINAGVKMCRLCGYNIAEQMLDLAFGEEVKAYPPNEKEGIILRYSQADFMWFIKSPDRFRASPSWFKIKNTHDYIFSIKDPLPYFTYTLDRMFRYRKEMQKRTH